jgi:hypothetical protein
VAKRDLSGGDGASIAIALVTPLVIDLTRLHAELHSRKERVGIHRGFAAAYLKDHLAR